MTKKQAALNAKNDAITKLKNYIKPGDTVFTVLESVSRSGMSRTVRVVVPYTREDGSIDHLHPNHLVSVACGYRQAKNGDGLVIGGCGFDAGHSLVYDLGYVLYGRDGFECIGEGCPANDHSNGDRDYTPHQHSDAGYSLRHRWL